MNDTNAMWRQVKETAKERAKQHATRDWRILHAHASAGRCTIDVLGETHWRIHTPYATATYFPTRGTIVVQGRQRALPQRGLRALLRALNLPKPSPEVLREAAR